MNRAKWVAMDWYKFSTFLMVLGFYLSFIAPLSPLIPLLDIPSSTGAIIGVSCFLIVIIQRLEALLEQISHIEFERLLPPARQTEEESDE